MTDIQVLDHAAQLPAEWDDLAGPGAGQLGRPWLRMSEDYAGVPMRYLLHYRAGALSSALATALTFPVSPWLYTRTDTVLEFGARDGLPGAAECLASLTGGRAVPRSVEEATRALSHPDETAPVTEILMPSLVCGGRQLARTRVLLREETAETSAVVSSLIARAEGVAAGFGARSIAFLYVDELDTPLRRALDEQGYSSCVSAQDATLFLPVGGFDGYKAMLQRKQRQSIAAERRKLEAAGVKVEIEPLTEGLIELLADLESQLFARHGGSWTPQQSAAALQAITREFGPDAFVSTARLDGALCGFTLVMRHRDDWYVHRAGFDYARIGDLPVYFEVTYNSIIEQAAANGVRALHFGSGAIQAKQLRGCTISTYFCAVKLLPGSDGR
ncbi:MAG TPA: GNAT family N-acetyltransferase [Streptosporangiaceae bacterium]|nr:GNAT family N-acetyltransferase [Streptosporangiaceae bacterium]